MLSFPLPCVTWWESNSTDQNLTINNSLVNQYQLPVTNNIVDASSTKLNQHAVLTFDSLLFQRHKNKLSPCHITDTLQGK